MMCMALGCRAIGLTLFTWQGLVFLIAALLVAMTIVELIRRRKLRESYAMLWLVVAAVLLLFGVFPDVLFRLSEWIRMDYRTVALLVCFLFLMVIVLQYSCALSRQAEDSRQLVQRVALLEERIERLEDEQERQEDSSTENTCQGDEGDSQDE